MKKIYNAPVTELVEVKIESLLEITSLGSGEADKGSSDNTVNFSRESDWEE